MQRNLTITIPALLAISVFMISLSLIANRDLPEKASIFESQSCLDSLNKRNALAKSVYCPSIRTGIGSNSSLFYRKEDKIVLSSWFLGLHEAFAGREGQEYSFWVRSFDAKSIYFCDTDNLEKTTLRPIMRPEVMVMISWIAEIDQPQGIERSTKGFVTHVKRGPMDILVEFDEKKVLTQSAFLNGLRIVTLEGRDFAEFSGLLMPRKIRVTWHEEMISGEFLVEKWIINANDPGLLPPPGLKRINLEDYSSSSRKSVSVSFSLVPDGQ